MAIYNLFVVDFLQFSQEAASNLKGGAASNTLTFEQDVTCNIKPANIKQNLIFNQNAHVNIASTHNAQDNILFSQHAGKVIQQDIHQLFHIWQTLVTHIGWNTLTFTQLATAQVLKPASNTLVFTQTATCVLIRNPNISQTLVFKSSAVGYINDSRFIQQYPVLPRYGLKEKYGTAASVTLIYSPSLGITLPAPDFGNTDDIDQTRINRKTRGGTLIIYRDSMWPTVDRFSLHWTGLKKNEMDALLDFLKATIGKIFTYTDFESNTWQVIATKPEGQWTQVSPGRYAGSIELELV